MCKNLGVFLRYSMVTSSDASMWSLFIDPLTRSHMLDHSYSLVPIGSDVTLHILMFFVP